jgi:uncharacterized membrane protein YbhN (UPF0104 family)
MAVDGTRRHDRRWLRFALLAVAGVAAVLALRGRVPDPAAVVGVLRAADPWWLAVAVLAQFLSQAAFARQQRTLLAALGTRIPAGKMQAITFSRSAISMALPAGSAASAAFALREYRKHGATTPVAAAAMLLSGLASAAGLFLLYLVSAGNPRTIATLLTGATVLGLAGWSLARRHRHETTRWPRLEKLRRAAAAIRPRDAAATVALAALNWLLDLFCLVAVSHACGFPLSWNQTATVYLAVQVIRQIPLTPGGIGLIEAGLLTGLVTAGAPEPAAAAVVLGYRLFSFWLILPVGLAAYLRLTRRHGDAAPADRCDEAGAGVGAGDTAPLTAAGSRRLASLTAPGRHNTAVATLIEPTASRAQQDLATAEDGAAAPVAVLEKPGRNLRPADRPERRSGRNGHGFFKRRDPRTQRI